MVTGEKTHSHNIHVFLNRSIHHFPHGLPDSGKNDLHAGIAQRPRNDFCTSIMAVEAGWVKAGEEIVALGGSTEGADTAVVLRPAFARKIKELAVCEVLCKPRLP